MAKQEKSTELVVKSDQALCAELNDFSLEHSGLIKVRKEILKVPRLKLTQKMSKQSGDLAKAGEFACEIRSQNYGTEVVIIPIMISESASFMDKETSQLICKTNDLIRSQDGHKCVKCPFKQYWNDWGTKDNVKVPECKSSFDVLCLVGEEKIPMEVNFRKMSYKAGKALVNFVANDRMPVPFCSSYKLKAREATKDQYKFFVIDEYMERTALTNEEIMKIIPVAKRIVELDQAGALDREDLVDEETSPIQSTDIPV